MKRKLRRLAALYLVAVLLVCRLLSSDMFTLKTLAYTETCDEFDVINTHGTDFYYNSLTSDLQKVYRALEERIDNNFFKGSKIDVSKTGTFQNVNDISKEDSIKILKAYMLDHPELFFTRGYEYSLRAYGDPYAIGITLLSDYNTPEIIERVKKTIDPIAESILEQCVSLDSPEQRADYIYDWLDENVEYEYDDKGKPSDTPEAHSLIGSLIDKSCVCEGYAKAFAYLADAAGIEVAYVVGQSVHEDGSKEPHAWNAVKLEGKWYWVDATWGGDENKFIPIDDKKFLSKHDFNSTEDKELVMGLISSDKGTAKYDVTKQTVTSAKLTINNKSPYTLNVYKNGMLLSTFSSKTYDIKEIEKGARLDFEFTDSKTKTNITVYKGSQNLGELSTAYYIVDSDISNNKYSESIEINSGLAQVLEVHKKKVGLMDERDIRQIKNGFYIITENGNYERDVNMKSSGTEANERIKELNNSDAWKPYTIYQYAISCPRVYSGKIDLSNLGLDTTSDLLKVSKTIDRVVPFTLNLNAPQGYTVVAMGDDGKRYYSGASVPGGTIITLSMVSDSGITTGKFYYSNSTVRNNIKDSVYSSDYGSNKKNIEMPNNKFVMLENATIKVVPDYPNITDINVETDYTIENGTLPYAVYMGLPLQTEATYANGDTTMADIVWDLSSYDNLVKEAHNITITGTVNLDENMQLANGVSKDISATVHVTAAKELSSMTTACPDSLTVPAGTLRTAYELGLPVRGEFKDSDGHTVVSEIIWTPDSSDSNYKMIGYVKRAGYHYPALTVDISEVGDVFTKTPSATAKFKIGNTEVSTISPTQSLSYNVLYSVEMESTHTDKVIHLTVPKGFTNVGVANAAILDGIKSTNIVENNDHTYDITIEILDSFDKGVFSFEVAMTSIFNPVENGDTLGMLYPSGTYIPINLNYEAKENGKTINADLDYSGRAMISGGELTNKYTASDMKDLINLGTTLQNALHDKATFSPPRLIPNTKSTDAFYVDYYAYIPFPEVITNVKQLSYSIMGGLDLEYDAENNQYIYHRDGYNKYGSHAIYAGDEGAGNSSATINKDLVEAGRYFKAAAPVHMWAIDYFGNEYGAELPTMSYTIYPYDDNTEFTFYDRFSDEVRFTLGNTPNIYNAKGDVKYTSTNTQLSIAPVNDVEIYIDLADGTTLDSFRTYMDDIEYYQIVYHDGNTVKVDKNDFTYVKRKAPDDTTQDFINIPNTLNKKSGNGIDKVVIHYGNITDEVNTYFSAYMQSAATYGNGDPIHYGSYYDATYSTDCDYTYGSIGLVNDSQHIDYPFLAYFLDTAKQEYKGYGGSAYYFAPSAPEIFDITMPTSYSFSATYTPTETPYTTNAITELTVNNPYDFVKVESAAVTWYGYPSEHPDSIITIYYSDGSSEILDDNEDLYEIKAPKGTTIEKIITECPKLYDNDGPIVYFDVDVDVKKCISENLCDQVLNIIDSYSISDNTKPDAQKGTIKVITASEEEYRATVVNKALDYKYPEVGSMTAISALKQKDNATLNSTLNIERLDRKLMYDEYKHIPDYAVMFDEVKLKATFSNSYVVPDMKNLPVITDYANKKITASSVKLEKTGYSSYYVITFEDVTLKFNTPQPFTFTMEPGIKADTGTSKLTLTTLSLTPSETQPYWDELEISDLVNVTRTGLRSEYDDTKLINVLGSFEEKVAMYGETAKDTGLLETAYRVDNGEAYNVHLHVFGNSEFENFEAIVSVPKKGDKVKVNGKEKTVEFDSTFQTVKADNNVVNPVYYYSYDGETYEEFNPNAREAIDLENIVSIKITADSTTNHDEIHLSFIAQPEELDQYTYVPATVNYVSSATKNNISYPLDAITFTSSLEKPALEDMNDTTEDPNKGDDVTEDPNKGDDITEDPNKGDDITEDPNKGDDVTEDPNKGDDITEDPNKDDVVTEDTDKNNSSTSQTTEVTTEIVTTENDTAESITTEEATTNEATTENDTTEETTFESTTQLTTTEASEITTETTGVSTEQANVTTTEATTDTPTTTTTTTNSSKDSTGPETGDTKNIELIMLLGIGAFGFCIFGHIKKKKLND